MVYIPSSSYRVRTKFTVVDPAVEEAHARLVAMRTGKFFSNGQVTQRFGGKTGTSMTRSVVPGDTAESVKAGKSFIVGWICEGHRQGLVCCKFLVKMVQKL